ncbi:hypothetical protein RZY48_004150 [Vibrio navarrensis]|uniref:Uncharacterized protein n=1 Tax=Vibrio navarrensis TaxID=29495 RepID=A0AAI9CY91_9VIBR|nr:hypothetical protein [Vibrio navarrensis]
MDSPKLYGVKTKNSAEIPEVTSISYDLWTLRICLAFNTSSDQYAYVDFDGVEGFRVLDEGQILEFWGEESNNFWLYEVHSNGWLSMESKRKGAPLLAEDSDLKEYLIAGVNECVSVIAYDLPQVIWKR